MHLEKMNVPDSGKESFNSISSEVGEIKKSGSGELFNAITNHSSNKLKQHSENFLNLDDYINANYNFEFLSSCLVSQLNSNKNNKNDISSMKEDLVPTTFSELIPKDKIHIDDSKNMSVLQNDVHSIARYVKILLDNGASGSIIHDSFVCTRKLNMRNTSVDKWSMIAESFATLSEAKVKIKLPEHGSHFCTISCN